MFYQIFFPPQMKRCAIITYKHGMYRLLNDWPNDLRMDLRKIGNISKNITNKYNAQCLFRSWSFALQIQKQKPKGKGYWKLNSSILTHKTSKIVFHKSWKNWRKQKFKYNTIDQWLKLGKIYLKILAIQYSKQQQQQQQQKTKLNKATSKRKN